MLRSSSSSEPGSSNTSSATSTSFSLSHLPPLTLTIAYPPDYPSHTPPTLLSITTPPQLSYLHSTILNTTIPSLLTTTYAASAPDPSLWTFLEIIRTGEFLSTPEDSASAVLDLRTDEETEDGLSRLRRKLEDWDRGMRGETFESTTYDCGICLEEKKGRKCLEMEGCGHVL